MKKVIFIGAILLTLVNCKREIEKEYYSNGNLKKEYFFIDDKYEGVLKKYYQSGQLKELHNYSNGAKVDSSLRYKKNGTLDYVDYHRIKDSISVYRKYLYENGSIKSEGFMHNGDFSVGYWRYYNKKEKYLEKIEEMKNINNQSHLNQWWQLDARGDTIYEKSVYASFLYFQDTIKLGEAVKVYAVKEEPLFRNKNSSVMAVVPKDYSSDFNEYFANFKEIEVDTTYNLNVDKEYRIAGNLPEGNYALEVIFGRYYSTPGAKKFKGILIEYCESDSLSIDSLEHKIYFEKNIYVKDTL